MPLGGESTVLVVKSHHPLRPQELRLFVGQRVRVRFRHATSGWWEGMAMGSGESGWFPGECVDDKGDDLELASPQAGTGGITVAMPKTPACSWAHTGGVPWEGAEGGGKPRQGGVGLLLHRSAQRRTAPPHSAAGTGAFIVSGVVPGFPAQQCGLIQRDDVLCKVDRYTLSSSLKVQDVNTLIRCVTVRERNSFDVKKACISRIHMHAVVTHAATAKRAHVGSRTRMHARAGYAYPASVSCAARCSEQRHRRHNC